MPVADQPVLKNSSDSLRTVGSVRLRQSPFIKGARDIVRNAHANTGCFTRCGPAASFLSHSN